jgi:protein-L-isoaspartate(D-aspartate) O-methyltransferase
MVAVMTQSLDLAGSERVLEIGAGSGYQTAILAELAAEVYAVEIHASLLERAETKLAALGYTNVHGRVGNGRKGWPEAAPFDRILCAAAASEVPEAWIDQLADAGVLVMPVGGFGGQMLVKVEKRERRVSRHTFCPCRFVPLLGGDR